MSATISTDETTSVASSTTRKTRMTRRFGTLLAGSILAGTFGFAAAAPAAQASASNTVSLKVCGVQGSTGKAESGAYILTYYWGTNGWTLATSYEGTTGPGGCGWVTVPSGHYWDLGVYRSPTLGSKYTYLQWCAVGGTVNIDYGTTGYTYFAPTATGGHNMGQVTTSVATVNCA